MCPDLPNLFKESSVSYCRKNVFAFAALFLMIVITYSNSLNCSWHFDDFINIVDNPRLHMKEITFDSVKRAICSDRNYPSFPYRPVAGLSFALNYYVGGLKVKGYHLVNIAIHFLSAIFLYLFIYRSLQLKTLQCYGYKAHFISLLATTLWAINPIQTQAVTYIVQRMASMAGMFYIAGMYFYLRARTARDRSLFYLFLAVCFIAFLLSLGSKENAAIFPVSVFLYELLVLQDDPVSFLKKSWPTLSVCIGATFLIGVFYLYYKTGHFFISSADFKNRLFTPGERLLTETRIVVYYLFLIYYPMPNRLCIVKDFDISTSVFTPFTTFFSIVLIVSLLGLGIILARRRPFISFAIFFFFINHLIESTIFPLELYFEHRNYIPSMFLFVPVAIAIAKVLEIYRNRISMRVIIEGFVILVIVGYGHSTFMRNFTWKTEESLWLDALSKSPNLPRVHHNLGKYYADRGMKDKGIRHYQAAIRLKRGSARETDHLTYYNLAQIYLADKKYEKAAQLLRKALKIQPRFSDAYNALASISIKKKDFDLAYDLVIKSLRYNSVNIGAYNNLALILMEKRQFEKALRVLKKAYELDEDNFITTVNLGIANKLLGRFRTALKQFRVALRRNPNEFFTKLQVAETYVYMGKPRLARAILESIVDSMQPEQIRDKLQKEYSEYVVSILPDKKILFPIFKQVLEERGKRYQKVAKEYFSD